MDAGDISMPDAIITRLSQSQFTVRLKLPFSAVNVEPRIVLGELAGETTTFAISTPVPPSILTAPCTTVRAATEGLHSAISSKAQIIWCLACFMMVAKGV